MSSLHTLTISQLQDGYRKGDFTPVDVLKALEARIDAVDPTSIAGYRASGGFDATSNPASAATMTPRKAP